MRKPLSKIVLATIAISVAAWVGYHELVHTHQSALTVASTVPLSDNQTNGAMSTQATPSHGIPAVAPALVKPGDTGKTWHQAPPLSDTNNHPTGIRRDSTDAERIAEALRLDLTHSDMLPLLLQDQSRDVRVAALERTRQLESEYETQNRIERRPNDPGTFAPIVAEALVEERDNFAIEAGLDYLAEYGGTNRQTMQGLLALLEKDYLSVRVLANIGEHLIENQGMDPAEVAQAILHSPSVDGLPPDMRSELEIMLHSFEPPY